MGTLERTLALLFTSVAACTALDPIIGPDGAPGDGAGDVDSAQGANDAIADGHESRDVAVADAGDASFDVAVTDSADEGDTAASPFTCGTKTCDAAAEYCRKSHDDGGMEMDTCIIYPSLCTLDGGAPSCGCIAGMCACSQSGADITVTCP